MRSFIPLLYLTVIAVSGVPQAAAADPDALDAQREDLAKTRLAADPDALYAQREDLDKARQAVEIWQARLAADPSDFESASKIARAMYWLGGHGPEEGRRDDLDAGMEAARQAIALEPDRPEGHFWLGATMGLIAEQSSRFTALRYRGSIKDALERVLQLDPAFQQGSADRALGRWYYLVPGLFGGSKEKSEEHLRRSLEYNRNSTASLYFLAETLVALDRPDEARTTLEKLLDVPIDPDWVPEDREFKEKARELLKELAGSR